MPYSVVRATQFMEFMDETLAMATDVDTVRLPCTPVQPIAAAEVAAIAAEVAAGMFAAAPGDVLTAPEGARIAATHCTDWLAAR